MSAPTRFSQASERSLSSSSRLYSPPTCGLPGGVRRAEHVDFDRDVDRLAADPAFAGTRVASFTTVVSHGQDAAPSG